MASACDSSMSRSLIASLSSLRGCFVSSRSFAIYGLLINCKRETAIIFQRMSSNGNQGATGVLIDCFSAIENEFARQLVARLRGSGNSRLAERLVELAGDDCESRSLLASAIGKAARHLVPDDEPPSNEPEATAWQELLKAADLLYGTAAEPLGRLTFISDRLLDSLISEAHHQKPEVGAGVRAIGPAGDLLAGLAASRQLREALSASLGFRVVPTYDAMYEYDPPGSHVRTHLDAAAFEFTFHLLLEQKSEGREHASVLIVHVHREALPRRLEVRPGEAVVLAGRGTIHSWAPLGNDEFRILTAIGFKRE